MKHLPLFSLLSLCTLALASTSCTVDREETIAFSAMTFPGTGIEVDENTPIQTLELPPITGSFTDSSHNKGTQVLELALRSVLADETDRTSDALKNGALVDVCPEGRAHLGFIQSFELKIRRQDQSDDQAVTLATYQKTEGADPCGIHFEPAGVDLSNYPQYTILPVVTGLPPAGAVSVGGFMKIEIEIGL